MTPTLKSLRLVGTGALLLTVAAFGPALHAQTTPAPAPAPGAGAPPPDHKGGPEHMLEHLKKALDLTDDQVAKLKPIFQAEADASKAIRDNSSLTDEEKHTQMKALRDGNKPKIEAILTPDQLEKFKAMKHGGPGGPGAGSPPAGSGQ